MTAQAAAPPASPPDDAALYCVIDCAADPRLHGAVLQSGRASALFAGKLDPALAETSPYLVQVQQNAPLMDLLASAQGRAGAYGCVLRAGPDMGPLWRVLRKKMLARLPQGQVVMFRFFDPRVMVPYLDSLTPEEQALWFDGITDWWLPLPGVTWHYTWQGGGVARAALPV